MCSHFASRLHVEFEEVAVFLHFGFTYPASASSVMNASERRAPKRGRIVEIVKAAEEYQGARQDVKDACPDPDGSMTKRTWEWKFRVWRACLKTGDLPPWHRDRAAQKTGST